ncbi:hypothetical protein NQ315_016944 [Exocentrus adspersus]|uniref:Transcription factor TFIIIC triple barrel domain-containing protein n=1 Tax=Exocentrus adspersus TaxID=1586481 RepID=A0AAV8VXS8_9CUCU|nr:hypothetical protein NQ315_016944 [Exocentrus adspersus]
MENRESINDESTYLYLDFNGKLSSDVFQDQVYFQMENLHKRNPLVQVNDSLFEGTYDHSIGTNLFFEKTDDNSQANSTFEKRAPIQLKHFLSSTKVLHLQQVKIPQAKVRIQNELQNINYNFTWDYKQLLQKFEDGSLQIEDISLGEQPPPNLPEHQVVEAEDEIEDNVDRFGDKGVPDPETEMELDKKLDTVLETVDNCKILEAEYQQLQILARRPVRRATSPEIVAECDRKYEDAYEYHNIEKQVLKPRDGFTSEVLQVDEGTLSDCVDIERCVLYGLIPSSLDFPRILSKDEKETLLTLENFDNLSLAGRYYVLQNIVGDLEKYIKSCTKQKLRQKDDYGRTPSQTLGIYKKLMEAARKRLQEIKFSLEYENCEGESQEGKNAEDENIS